MEAPADDCYPFPKDYASIKVHICRGKTRYLTAWNL